MSDMDNVTRGLSEMMIADVLDKHGIVEEQKRPLSDEEKDRLRTLVEDLKTQVEQFVQHQPTVPVRVQSTLTPHLPKTVSTAREDNQEAVSSLTPMPRTTLRKKTRSALPKPLQNALWPSKRKHSKSGVQAKVQNGKKQVKNRKP